MAKYFDAITDGTKLKRNIGARLVVSPNFRLKSSAILSQCTFAQSLIQQIIYTTHGDQLVDAKRTLKKFPNPKARFDFLCEFPFTDADPIIYKVFQFARTLFREIYEFRNVLAHETWSSSEQFPNAVLFSSLDDESRLLLATGKLWYTSEITPQQVYDATVRFIRNAKIVTVAHLETAIRDADLCCWVLMNINNVLNESDTSRKEEARQAFLVYSGTSHLFDNPAVGAVTADYSGSKSKTITDP